MSGTYGFDCVRNALAGASDERYVGLSADGSAASTRVMANANASRSSKPRRGAAKRIPAKKLADLFKALGLPGGIAELG